MCTFGENKRAEAQSRGANRNAETAESCCPNVRGDHTLTVQPQFTTVTADSLICVICLATETLSRFNLLTNQPVRNARSQISMNVDCRFLPTLWVQGKSWDT